MGDFAFAKDEFAEVEFGGKQVAFARPSARQTLPWHRLAKKVADAGDSLEAITDEQFEAMEAAIAEHIRAVDGRPVSAEKVLKSLDFPALVRLFFRFLGALGITDQEKKLSETPSGGASTKSNDGIAENASTESESSDDAPSL